MLKRLVILLCALIVAQNQASVFARGCGGGGGFGRGSFGGFGNRGFGSLDRDLGDRSFGGGGMDSAYARGFDNPAIGRDVDRNFGRPGFDTGIRDYSGVDRGFADRPIDSAYAGRGAGFDRISALGNSAFAGHHLRNYPDNWINNHGNLVRNNFYGHPFWGRDWWNNHPWGWYYPGWGWGGAAVWYPADWAALAAMLGMDAALVPAEYDYGNNVTYNNNEVYYGDQPYASADQYYQQAQTLATSYIPTSKPTAGEKWKALGVFSLVQGQQTDSTTVIQLAIDGKGDVAGNYFDMLSDQGQQLHGKLNKKTQRVAWTVGNNKNVVYDTAMGNLLSNQAPILVHFGKERTEQFLLVRLNKPDGEPTPTPASSSQTPKG